MQPSLHVVAGPNGIGKTSSVATLLPANTPIVNSDEIAAAIAQMGTTQPNINVQELGNREATLMVDHYMQQKASFAIETNLADQETWKFLLQAQKNGYEVNLIFLSCDDLEILNLRIQQRVAQGGHFVRPDIVEERYYTGLKLLNHYLDKPDIVQLIDNTTSPVNIAEFHKGMIASQAEELPVWVSSNLSKHFESKKEKDKKPIDLKSVDEVREAYKKGKGRRL